MKCPRKAGLKATFPVSGGMGLEKQMRPDPATTNALLALFVTFQLDKNRLKK